MPLGLGRFPRIVEFNEHRATLFCCGNEDRSTQAFRRQALARAIRRAQTDVTVDLTELAFADASLMLDLAALARRLRVRDRALLLRRPQPQVKTLIETVGVHRLPGVSLEGPSPSPSPALA